MTAWVTCWVFCPHESVRGSAAQQVAPPPPAVLNGRITYSGRTNHKAYAVISLKDIITHAATDYELLTDTAGNYTIANVPAGTYHALCYSQPYLARLLTPVVVPAAGAATANFLDLRNGDMNADNRINVLDLSGFSTVYGSTGDTMP